MYGESLNTASHETEFIRLAGGILQNPRTAETVIPRELACPARTQAHRHLLIISVVERDETSTRASVLTYSRVREDASGDYLIEAHTTRHAAGEDPSKCLGFDEAAECEAEAEAALQLLRKDLSRYVDDAKGVRA